MAFNIEFSPLTLIPNLHSYNAAQLVMKPVECVPICPAGISENPLVSGSSARSDRRASIRNIGVMKRPVGYSEIL
jgi:hypothetical protein